MPGYTLSQETHEGSRVSFVLDRNCMLSRREENRRSRGGNYPGRSAARRICLSISSRSVGGVATFINETRILCGPRWLRSPVVGTSYFIEARLYFRAYDFNCRCGLRLYFFSSFTGARSTAPSRKRQSPLKPGMPACQVPSSTFSVSRRLLLLLLPSPLLLLLFLFSGSFRPPLALE